jgi:hypothetical protein
VLRHLGTVGLRCRPVALAASAGRGAALLVDQPAGRRGDQPGAGVVGDAVARPGRVRGDEGLLGGILGGGEVAAPAGEDADDLRRQVAQQVVDAATWAVETWAAATWAVAGAAGAVQCWPSAPSR